MFLKTLGRGKGLIKAKVKARQRCGPSSAEVFYHHQIAASPGEEREEQPSAVRRGRQAGDAARQNAINLSDRLFGSGREAEEFDC